jgi:hypothetical protein
MADGTRSIDLQLKTSLDEVIGHKDSGAGKELVRISTDNFASNILVDSRSADAFGFVPDDPTKTAENDAAWVAWQAYLKTLYDAAGESVTKKLIFGQSTYYFGDTMHAKYRTWIEGSGTGLLGIGGRTKFVIPAKKAGLVINRHNTLGAEVVESSWAGADGSVIRGIHFEQTETGNKAYIPYAFGIWCKARAVITDCTFSNIGNHAIAVFAASDGEDSLGNANGTIIERCSCTNSPAAAVWFWGTDANAGYTKAVDAVHCAFAIRDDSFLGNTHYSPQWNSAGFDTIENWNVAPVILVGVYQHIIRRDGSGQDDDQIAGALINPPAGDGTHNDWWICVGDDGEEDSDYGNQVTWGRVQDDDGLVYDAQPGQYANMWNTKPTSSATVWGSGSAPAPGVKYIQWATASQMVNKTGDWAGSPFNIGPYAFTGGYHAVGAWPVMVGAYQEGDSPSCQFPSPTARVYGGNMSFGPDTVAHIRRDRQGQLVLPNGKVLIDGGLDDNQTYENGDVILDNVGQEDGYFGEQVTDDGLGSVVELTTVPLFFAQVAILKPGTVSQLPTASSYTGAFATVTDALKPTRGSTVVGSGAVRAIVQSNGTNWIVIHCPPLVDTFGNLPAANSVVNGAEAIITDCNTTTLGATAAGGGANRVRVNSDLTNWKVG